MGKILVIKQNGYEWAIPYEVIAKSRAEFYKEDGYDEEYKYTMESDSEISDWFFGNMDWQDVVKEAYICKTPMQTEPDFSEDYDYDFDIVPPKDSELIGKE